MKRRDLLVAVPATLAALGSLGVLAQPQLPLIAVLLNATETAGLPILEAFREGLHDLGYREGRNYRLEVRWSEARVERLPELARELLLLKPAVGVANQVLAAQALHRESSSIPIVMLGGSGAQRVGLIQSLAKPAGNVTGLTNQSEELTTKLFELLRDIAPRARRVVALTSGQGVIELDVRAESRAVAQRYGMTLIEVVAESPSRLLPLAERCARVGCDALVSLTDPNLVSFRGDIIALAGALHLPAVYSVTAFTDDGGLISYSADYAELSRRAAAYVDKILKGAKPGSLPIEQPNKFELVVNMKTANTLGIKMPQSILVRADRIIE